MKKLFALLLLTTSVFAENQELVESNVTTASHVLVTIVRVLPEKTQHIQRMLDKDEFYMWMESKMELGCDPYVTSVNFKFLQELNEK